MELALSGRTVTVPPGVPILRAVEEAGVPVLSSCREGTCGTCETPVLAGVPEHRDSLLSAQDRAAGDTMLICVSRARTPGSSWNCDRPARAGRMVGCAGSRAGR